MKTYTRALLVLLAAVGLFGRVHSRVTSGVSGISRTGNEIDAVAECRHEAVSNSTATVAFVLLNKQYECYKPSGLFLGKLNTAPNKDAYRGIFRTACAQEAAVLSCVADVSVEASPCLDETETKMFDTVRDFVENSIEATCANGSEVVATMYGDELKLLGFGSQLRVLGCVNSVATKTTYDAETDLPAYTLRRYRAMKEGRSCILNVARAARRSAEGFERFMDALLDTSKCIDAGTHEIVLCKKLEPEQDIQQ